MKWLIIFILILPIISAQNISIDYPSEVCIGNEFEIRIKAIEPGTYDIKIDILQDKERLTRIWNGYKWASTMYYLDGFDTEETFSLKAEKTGYGDIIIRLRDDKTISFLNYNITIIECLENPPTADRLPQEEGKKEEKIKKFVKSNSTVKKMDPIMLTPQTIKTNNDSKNLDTGYAKYSIVPFCALLAFLYFRKYKKNKNEFVRKPKDNCNPYY